MNRLNSIKERVKTMEVNCSYAEFRNNMLIAKRNARINKHLVDSTEPEFGLVRSQGFRCISDIETQSIL